MASSKLMVASNSRKSDLSRRSSSSTKSQLSSDRTKRNSTMTVDGLLRTVCNASPAAESTLLNAQVTLIDSIPIASTTTTAVVVNGGAENSNTSSVPKTVDEVWREIVSGDRNEMKEEALGQITLEDFLAKTGALVAPAEDDGVKVEPAERISGGVFAFEPMQPASPFQVLDKVEGSIIGFGNGMEEIGEGGGTRRKRGRAVLEPLDKAAQQRQRRMIKNRESAARSRERKQAYQVELESLAVKLEEENELLIKEKEERTKGRFKQLMEKVVPVEEKRKPVRVLRRVRSLQW